MKDNQLSSCMDEAYGEFLLSIREHDMEKRISEGILLGLSGGADSMLLLHLLLRYRKEKEFPLLAVHIHHGIRGKSADRDADFCEQACKALGVAFVCKRFDVPSYAKEKRMGIEEAARSLRYSCFDDIIRGRNDVATIALAHNATDNLETVIFHLMRGCGSGGLGGIAPVRDNVIRPLITLTKAQICDALSEAEIDYVSDETNSDTQYTRNYIRHEILPKLYRLSPSPEVSVRRVCRNLINDDDYLNKEAERCFLEIKDGKASIEFLSGLHSALRARVLLRWAGEYGVALTQRQIECVSTLLLRGGRFSYDLCGGYCFFADRGFCSICKRKKMEKSNEAFERLLIPEQTELLPGGAFIITHNARQIFSPNIYNFSIKANLSSAIIEGELFIRYRREGDSYYYGGMTHKLKKLFNDKKIPISERDKLPILCDQKGILWVPGFGVRDDGGLATNALYAAFFYSCDPCSHNAMKGTES